MFRNFIGVGALCVVLLGSCGGGPVEDTCGGSVTQQKVHLITGYSASLFRYDQPITLANTQLPKPLATNESPAWNTFSIEVKAAYQSYQASALPKLRISLFPQAMACSPTLPVGKQKITKISITSANDFSAAYPAGSELVGLFGSIDHGALTLTGLLVNYPSPLQLRLKLLDAPQFARQNFEIKITLDDGSVYLVKTGDVYFTLS